ncbi:ABC transporter permease [Anaerobranca californiensis]|uniref:ABC transporter permease n=1 Tax=Anaerobranca californiensis TaxID=182411 RepID=UPI000933B9F1|nr:ABC transporter permease [Anaerobranca californiensis]
MIKYVLKSLISRKKETVLFIIAIVVSLSVSMAAINISSGIKEGIIKADGEYDIIIGPNGSDIQLLLSTLFFSEHPLGVISYGNVEKLKERGDLEVVIPFALGDNYRGYNLIGTSPLFLKNREIREGRFFENPFEVVVGYNVAKKYSLKIGDQIITSHGIADHSINSLACLFHSHGEDDGLFEHDDHPYTVVGILNRDYSPFDNGLFTGIESIWLAHNYTGTLSEDEKLVTAIVIRSGNQRAAREVTAEYNEKGEYQAIHPTEILRKLLKNFDLSKQVAFLLSTIIVILALIIVFLMILLMINSIGKEIKILRFIGWSKENITKYILYQGAILSILSFGFSRIFTYVILYFANKLSSSMGLVLNISKIYPLEFLVAFAILLISITPIIFYLNLIYSRELIKGEN